MKHHFNYLWYVLRHKYFVFLAGRKTGAPLWRLVIHDWSKFTPAEWNAYVDNFYRYKDRSLTAEMQEAFDLAWLHHQHNNPHHWQHWVLREDSGQVKAMMIPEPLVREMVADWMGAGRAITGRWETQEWYDKNKEKMILNDGTRHLVEALLKAHA